MTNKIFRSTVFVAVFVLLCSIGVIMGVLYDHITDVHTRQLKDELSLAVTGTEQYGDAFLENVEADRFRITWIDTDGNVLFDSKVNQVEMENHANREEIQEAMNYGSGSSVRNSSTLTEKTYYEAQRLQDGTILRISANQESAWSLMMGMFWPVVLILSCAIALSSLLARRMAMKIVKPLNALDLEQPLKNEIYEEIVPLLHRIHHQNFQIKKNMEELRHRADEFQQITDNMQEALVLLDGEGMILSMNPAAKEIFDVQDDYVGKYFLSLERSSVIHCAINDVYDKGQCSANITWNGRNYHMNLNRIQSKGIVIGAVILAFDITERMQAEKMRREFSANVSHELKTPLQGIIGSAELLESGMVRKEDESRFVGHIRKESSRLLSLIDDIIHLSQLDEDVLLPKEETDLLLLAKEVVDVLENAAEQKGIAIHIQGSGFSVNGVRRILYEMLYNLCDNAIKYNVPNGSVTILVENNHVTVSDTGIGIDPEHKDRIFERFYRVDKSHSKASGGTGLGLSIVKHAAIYHNAEVQLESVPGKGTSISIIF